MLGVAASAHEHVVQQYTTLDHIYLDISGRSIIKDAYRYILLYCCVLGVNGLNLALYVGYS
jgi:hypothetical protein